MRKVEPTSVGDVLAKLKKDTQLGEQLEQAGIWEHWAQLAGTHLSKHGQPKWVKDGTLRIEAESTVWMHRFAYAKWDIIKRINRMARRELVSDVFVVLAQDAPSTPPQDTV